MRQRTILGVTHTQDGARLAHRTDQKRDLCIMACAFCRDERFQEWLSARAGGQVDEAGAKAYILTACQVTSRNELDTNPAAAERFHELVRRPFVAWKDLQAERATP